MSERPRPPVVVLTALEVEYEAVRARLTDLRQAPAVARTRFETGTLVPGGGTVVLALTGAGNHGAAVVAERALREFAPLAVLFVGIAGGLHAGLQLGDVVVATQVYAYHGAAARPGGLRSRPRVWEIDHGVDQAARDVSRRRTRTSRTGPRVHFGPVASGEVLHDDRESAPLHWIREHYDDAVAVEMEAAGVAKAGQLGAVPVAVVRAISDRADGTKAATDGRRWQHRAADAAADFAVELAAELIGANPGAAGGEPPVPDPAIRVETHGGSHGVVAGIVHGGVRTGRR